MNKEEMIERLTELNKDSSRKIPEFTITNPCCNVCGRRLTEVCKYCPDCRTVLDYGYYKNVFWGYYIVDMTMLTRGIIECRPTDGERKWLRVDDNHVYTDEAIVKVISKIELYPNDEKSENTIGVEE